MTIRANTNYMAVTVLAAAILSVTACGGGGSSSSSGSGGGGNSTNTAPTASAGVDQTVESGTGSVTLTGAGTDSDGTISSYSWAENTGNVSITGVDSATATFTAPTVTTDTTLTFTLTVTDNDGATATDNIIVTVTAPVSLASTSDSNNWTILNRTPIVIKAVFTGSYYVAVGYYGYLASSTDGLSWTEFDVGSTTQFVDVATSGSKAVAIPLNGPGKSAKNYVAATTNGSNWQIYSGFENTDCAAISSIAYDSKQFVGIFDNNKICTSVNGSSWTLQSTQAGNLQGIAFGGGRYAVLISNSTAVITINEADLNTTISTVPALPVSLGQAPFTELLYGGDKFVGIKSGQVTYLSDASNIWEVINGITVPSNIKTLSYSSAKGYVAISKDSTPVVYTSADAITWSVVNGSTLPFFGTYVHSVVNGSNETLLFDSYSLIYRSVDQVTWDITTALHPTSISFYFKRNNTLLVQSGAALMRSADNGASWSVISDPVVGKVSTDDSARLYMNGDNNNVGIYYSNDDGVSWNSAIAFNSFNTLNASVKLGTTTYTFTDNGQYAREKPVLSSDDGVTFQVNNGLYASTVIQSNFLGNVQQAVSGNSVIVGITNNTIVSYNGASWTAPKTALGTLKDVVFNGTNFVVVGASGLVMTSPDGTTWTTQTWLNTTATITDVLVAGTDLYATDNSGKIAKSINNGVDWLLSKDLQAATVLVNNVVTELAYNGSNIFGFGTNTSNISPVTMMTSGDNGASWSVSTFPASVGSYGAASHVFYDVTNTRFVTYLGFESADGINWTAVTQYPDDASFAYIATKAGLAGLQFGPVRFTPASGTTPASYVSGSAASSTDGLNWVIKTGQPNLTADYTPISGIFAKRNTSNVIVVSNDDVSYSPATLTGLAPGVSTLSFIKYVNNQYVGVALNGNTGKTGFYISSNGSDWSLTTEENLGGGVVDIAYDGNQYLILLYQSSSNTGLGKGAMIIKTADLQTFSLLETGIRAMQDNIYVEANGYALVGQEANIATRAFYQ